MKGHLLDIATGFLSGVMWIYAANAISSSFTLKSQGASVILWLTPDLLIFAVYTQLPIYKKTHLDNRRAMLWSFARFFIVGFFILSYFCYGVVLISIYYQLW
jgi:hypothetical protein